MYYYETIPVEYHLRLVRSRHLPVVLSQLNSDFHFIFGLFFSPGARLDITCFVALNTSEVEQRSISPWKENDRHPYQQVQDGCGNRSVSSLVKCASADAFCSSRALASTVCHGKCARLENAGRNEENREDDSPGALGDKALEKVGQREDKCRSKSQEAGEHSCGLCEFVGAGELETIAPLSKGCQVTP